MRAAIAAFLILAVLPGPSRADDSGAAADAGRAAALDAEAERLAEEGRPRDALPLAREALAIRERVLPAEDARLAESHGNVGLILHRLGDHDGARPHLERALAIREKALGRDHIDTAKSCNNLALLLVATGDYGAALPLYERTLAICEKTLGPEHPHTLLTVSNLASLFQARGDLAAAGPLFKRALAASEKVNGRESPETARCLDHLGQYLQAAGDARAARAPLLRALAIREKTLGPDHPLTATSANNLATYLHGEGELAAARDLYERTLAVYERALGAGHPYTATVLNNLGHLLMAMGDLERARPLFERALAAIEAGLGKDHVQVARQLDSLALLRWTMADFDGAQPLYERALAICERTLGPDHAETGDAADHLALLLVARGRDEEARPLAERALRVREKALGPDHPHAAKSLGTVAWLRRAAGDPDGARPLLARQLAVLERAFGPDHPVTAGALADVADLLSAEGRLAAARPLVERALRIRERVVRDAFAAASERQRLALVHKNRVELERYLYVFAGDEERRLAAVLRWKGAVGRALAAERALLRLGADEEMAATLERLRAVQTKLARSWLPPVAGAPQALVPGAPRPAPEARAAAGRDEVARLAAEKEALEVAIARESADFREARALSAADLRDVRAALPPGAALVEVFVFGGRYGAWVVRDGARAPAFVDLGTVADVDAAVDGFRRALAAREPEARIRAAGEPGRERVWKPIRAALGEARTVLMAPDGALGALPLAALPGDEPGAYLVESYTFGYLVTGLDLVRALREPPAGPPARGALVVGGVDFEAGAAAAGEEGEAGGGAGRRFSFPPLPGAAGEAKAVAERFRARFKGEPAVLLGGAEATEAALKQRAPGRRWLHLATHGFVARVPGAIPAPAAGARGSPAIVLGTAGAGASRVPDDAPVVGLDPMALAGVVLAGANRGRSGAGEDGVLTAAEASGLALDGTELVVLSACESGLGAVARGEGVLGLARGFSIAGARALVLAVLEVPDEATRELMGGFYAELWDERRPPAAFEALRRAQLAALAGRRAAGDAAPWAWGGFVVVGAP